MNIRARERMTSLSGITETSNRLPAVIIGDDQVPLEQYCVNSESTRGHLIRDNVDWQRSAIGRADAYEMRRPRHFALCFEMDAFRQRLLTDEVVRF